MKFQPLDLNGFVYAVSLLSQKIAKKFDSLAKVANSGNYIDLTNRPEIPPAVAVKGDAETTYRTGDVNLTPENLGIDIMQGSTTTTPGKAGLVPAPSAGDEGKTLTGDGVWRDTVKQFTSGLLSTPGWYRVAKISKNKALGSSSWLVLISRPYNNTNDESDLISICTSYKSGAETNASYKTLNRKANTTLVDKIRFAADSENIKYFEVYYNGSTHNQIGIKIISAVDTCSSPNSDLTGVGFVPATEDETVVSEYAIPEKDDFDTSKSLTRGTKILDNSDLKSDMYCIPGNYYSGDSAAIVNYTNRPPQLTSAFRLYVSYGVNDDYYIQQRFEDLLGRVIVVRTKYGRSSSASWSDEYVYYPSVGSPGANKLWGTDANGRIGWIDPPLASRVAEVENKTRYIISSGGNVYENGWYLLSELEPEYTDAIIMIHKGFNNSTSNGYIIGYSYQHNQVDSDKDGTFNIINKSGTGAFKDIAIVDYKGNKYFAVRINRGNTDPELFLFTIYGNTVSNKLKKRFEFIGANPENFTIMRRKTLSS